MKLKTIEEINQYKSKTVNPLKNHEVWYELYSVPNYEFEVPEILQGKDIASSKQVVEEGDILISKINPRINRVWIVGNFSEHLKIASSEWIVIRNSKISSKYLSYYFKTEKFRNLLSSQVTGIGGSLTRAQPKNVENYNVPIFSIEYQEKVVSILEKISELIKLRQSQITALDELTQSLFLEMFGEDLAGGGFPKKTLQDIAIVSSSKRVFVNELVNKGIPFFRGTEIGELAEGKDISPELFITEEHYRNLKEISGVPKIGDLLMPSICPDGRIWIVKEDSPFYFKDGRVLWINFKDNSVNPVYIQYALKIKLINNYLKIASGTTFAELKIFSLKNIELIIPPVELQNAFAERVLVINNENEKMKKSLLWMEDLYNSLLQKAFKGELFPE